MRLTRIRIEALRRFSGVVTIDRLQPDINLFVGPNGAGKSTIVAAIRAAFFERHRAATVTDLLPWRDSTAAPTVEIDFETGGHCYRLMKRFLARPRCTLEVDGTLLDGGEAEDRLAALLGFEHAGKGSSRPALLGVPGLLWIEQGSGQRIHDEVGHATGHLRRALEASLGEMASTGGDDLVQKVLAERDKLLTAGRGQARGELLQSRDAVTAFESRIAALAEQCERYREQVDSFAALNAAIDDDLRRRPWDDLAARAAAARRRLDEVDRARQALAADRALLMQTLERLRLLQAQHAGFAGQREQLAQRRAAVRRAITVRDDAEAAHGAARQRLAVAQAGRDATRFALEAAGRRHRRIELRRQLEALGQRRRELGDAASRAEAIGVRLAALREAVALHPIDDAQLAGLRSAERDAQMARIRVDAVATTVRHELQPGWTIDVAGRPCSGSGALRISATTVLDIPTVGTLTIEPGGGDLAVLVSARDRADEALRAGLDAVGLGTLAEAEARLRQRREAEQALAIETARLEQLAPGGVASLQAGLDEALPAIAAIQAQLDGLPAEPQAVAPDRPDPADPADATRAADVDRAREAHALAEAQWQSALAAEQQARAAWTVAAGTLAHAETELNALAADVDGAEWRERLERSRVAVDSAQAQADALVQKVEAVERTIDAASPEVLRQDAERLSRAADLALEAHRKRREAQIALESQLESAGAAGLEEALADVVADHERAQRRLRELERRALALDRLAGMLQDKRRILTQRLQAPLLRHMNRYVQLLLPGAAVTLDEALAPRAVTQESEPAGSQGRFDELSFGTREQIGLISRLAYADLLREAGHPTLIILDDGLVHSDAARLGQMKRVLFDAGARHQILMFTCHPERWQDLGAEARDVASLIPENRFT